MLISKLRIVSDGIKSHALANNNKLGAWFRFFKWQCSQYLKKSTVIISLVEESKMIAKKGMTGITGNIYLGLADFEDMMFVLHVLRPGDIFYDIGANVGAYSILASVNAKAKTISIEPIPATFSILTQNVYINNAENKITVLNIGLADITGSLIFTTDADTVNHVKSESENQVNCERVEVSTLDEVTAKYEIPEVLKLDVEGFEYQVLNGGLKTLSNQKLKAIIIELNGSGCRYGYDDSFIIKLLLENGFSSYSYKPFLRKLINSIPNKDKNTLFIRDINWINERVKSAKKYKILNYYI